MENPIAPQKRSGFQNRETFNTSQHNSTHQNSNMKGYTGTTPTVDAIGKLGLTGNVIPRSWSQWLKYENGKPNPVAIMILAELCYWYRPMEEVDEVTGKIVGWRKKFKADILQKSYQDLAECLGFTVRQIADNCRWLKNKGIIKTETRDTPFGRNRLFIDLCAIEIDRISFSLPKSSDEIYDYVSTYPSNTLKRNTYTEITSTEITSRSKEKEINQYPELTQESECAIAEEFSHLKEDSLTKKKAGTRSRTIQQSKSTLDEPKTLEIKTPTPQPPSPPVDRPTKKSKNPLDALTEDKDGWLVAPTKGTYKLAGIITLRRMQYAIASTFLSESYEFEFNENGELEVIYKGDVLTWQEFEKDYPIGMLRTIALHDPAASGCCDREWWDETLKEFFLESVEFCKRSKDALTVSRSQPASVLFKDIEPDEDDED